MPSLILRPEISYYTLALCILKNITIEDAFHTIAPDPDMPFRKIKQQQLEEMVTLKRQGMGNTEIGEIYGIQAFSVYQQLRRYRNEQT